MIKDVTHHTNFLDKTLTLVTYSSITRNDGTVLVNSAFGMLIDDLSKSFKKVYYVACEAETRSSVYRDGSSIYQYSIKSDNVIITPIQPTSSLKSPVARFIRMVTNQARINAALNCTDYVYIFLPGYTGLLTASICIVKRKPFFLYFGSDWNETALFRIPEKTRNKLFNLIVVKTYVLIENQIIKRALFCLAAGKRLAGFHIAKNRRTFETVPMVQFRGNLSGHVRSPVVEHTAIARDLNTTSKKRNLIILCVGNVKEGKGTVYLLRALPRLQATNFHVMLQLVGAIDDVYKAMLVSELRKMGFLERVQFVGYVNDANILQSYYQSADVFVLPTLGEGFPRVLYEAMLSGLPVVASDIPSIRENTEGTEALTLVPPKDPNAIAEAVELIMNNDLLRRRQIEAGYMFVQRIFLSSPAAQVNELLRRFTP